MEKYTEKQIEQLKSVENTNTFGIDNEEFIRFLDYQPYYPLKVIMVGKTYPNENYYVYRQKSDISVVEYINSGEGVVFADGKKINVCEGDFIYLRSGAQHNYYSRKSNPYTKTWMNFSSSILDELAEKVGFSDVTVIRCRDVGAYFDSLIEITSRGVTNSNVVNAIFQLAVSIILRAGDELHIESSYALADKIKESLDCAIYTSRNVSDICHELGYSRQQVAKVFAEKYELSPIEYLTEKRIDAACLALKYSNVPVKKICGMLGFSSQQYFSLVFKNRTGMNPVDYRKEYADK